jgi:hypothetical protein
MAVDVPAGDVSVMPILSMPPRARGVVVFAHGSGSGRFSPRNRHVARVLFESGFATLLTDLLTAAESAADARTGHLRFDIPLLGGCVIAAIDWLSQQAIVGDVPRSWESFPWAASARAREPPPR